MIEDDKIKVITILSIMFGVDSYDITTLKSRKKNKVKARKYFNYYLNKHQNIKHVNMHRYIKNISHSNSVYLKKQMEFEMEFYPNEKTDWINFLFFADYNAWENLATIKNYNNLKKIKNEN
tara:strand:+ start:736 stop:1098 length:363 start_codon:yes stop_codon:yes gene_type:complete